MFSHRGYLGIKRLKQIEKNLNNENLRLKLENERLQQMIDYRMSERYLEEMARTELGYARDGETVIRVMTPTPGHPPDH